MTVVAPGRNDGLLSAEEKQTVTQVQEEHRQFLRIPRRSGPDCHFKVPVYLTLFRLGFFGVPGPGGGLPKPPSKNPKVLTRLS